MVFLFSTNIKTTNSYNHVRKYEYRSMLKRFLILFVVTYFTISLCTSSSFQNNNLIQQKNFDLFDNNLLQLIYALHVDKDKGVNEFDIEDDKGKDEEDEEDDEDKDDTEDCKDDEGNKGKDDEDKEDDNNNENDECKNENDNENLKLLDDDNPPNANSSIGDEFATDSSSFPSEIDSNLIDQFNDLQDLAQINPSESSNLADLSNPPPFSGFQDPIPEQPGQPLHPDLQANPTLPPEPAEPRNPPIPPP